MDNMGANMDPILACRDRLRHSGVDLSAYNTRSLAADALVATTAADVAAIACSAFAESGERREQAGDRLERF